MYYNAQAVAATRSERDQKLRQTFRSNRVQLPWVRVSQFDDGQLRIRFWPGDDKKNPFGIFRYKKHTVEKIAGGKGIGKYETFMCPRTYSWDPLPTHWEDEETGQISQGPVEGYTPQYKERCAGCEILAACADIYPQLPGGLQEALSYLAGDDEYYLQCSIVGTVTSRTQVPRSDGNGVFEQVRYGPDHTGQNLTHIMLTIPEGYGILNKLLALFAQCPDFANVQVGRWFTLMKQNNGIGAGGYDVMCDPHPSPAGFEIPDNLYQDFSKWGKGGKKASIQLPYNVQEQHILQSQVLCDLRHWGIPLSDAEASQMDAGGALPQPPASPLTAGLFGQPQPQQPSWAAGLFGA